MHRGQSSLSALAAISPKRTRAHRTAAIADGRADVIRGIAPATMSAAATDASKLTEDEADELVMIVNLVRERSAWGPVSLDVVRETIGVNLQSRPALMDQLRRNPRIEVGMDGSLSFRRPFDIRDPEDILTVLRRHPHGVAEADVLASGPAELREAVATLVAEGRLIRMRSIDGMRSNVLFPRLNPLVVELPVTVEVASGQQWLTPSTDMTSEVNRGDLLLIGQVPRRVSTETRNGGLYTRSLHAERTGAQDSAAPLMPHTVRDSNPYTEAFTASRVPLDRPLPDLLPSGQRIDEKAVTVSVARIGLSSDLRSLWRDVRENSTRHFGFTYPTDQLRFFAGRQAGKCPGLLIC